MNNYPWGAHISSNPVLEGLIWPSQKMLAPREVGRHFERGRSTCRTENLAWIRPSSPGLDWVCVIWVYHHSIKRCLFAANGVSRQLAGIQQLLQVNIPSTLPHFALKMATGCSPLKGGRARGSERRGQLIRMCMNTWWPACKQRAGGQHTQRVYDIMLCSILNYTIRSSHGEFLISSIKKWWILLTAPWKCPRLRLKPFFTECWKILHSHAAARWPRCPPLHWSCRFIHNRWLTLYVSGKKKKKELPVQTPSSRFNMKQTASPQIPVNVPS